jgi:hypothetical protein
VTTDLQAFHERVSLLQTAARGIANGVWRCLYGPLDAIWWVAQWVVGYNLRRMKKKRNDPRPQSIEQKEKAISKDSVIERVDETQPIDGKQCSDTVYQHYQIRLQKNQNWISGLGAIVGVLGLIIVYFTLKATEASVSVAQIQSKTAQDTLIVSQRPWVGLEGKPQFMFDGDEHPIRWRYTWQNRGDSPALHLSWHARMFTFPIDRINWPLLESTANSLTINDDDGFAILLNGQTIDDVGKSRIYLKVGETETIKNASEAVILVGKVTYVDEFGAGHTTTFCRRYYPAQDGFPDEYFPCRIHEKAD